MSEMTPKESIERFSESLKKVASRFREMSAMQGNIGWTKLAFEMEKLLAKGETFYRQKALTRSQTLELADQILGEAASDAPKKP